MKPFLKFTLFLLLVSFQFQIFAQLRLEDIKLERIHQRKVRKYIKSQISHNKHLFGDIHPTYTRGKDLSKYSKNEMTFVLDGNFRDIWQGYLSANPTKSWNGRKVSFGLLVQKFPNNIFYNHDSIGGIDTGQVYFLNLKLAFGFFSLPVAFEVITIDSKEKIFEFSYIEGNKSAGFQQIKFQDMGENRTKILHTSYFKSYSPFRDRWIYPFFHKKIVNDFHRNMKNLLRLNQ